MTTKQEVHAEKGNATRSGGGESVLGLVAKVPNTLRWQFDVAILALQSPKLWMKLGLNLVKRADY
jgi:hypothetical protein